MSLFCDAAMSMIGASGKEEFEPFGTSAFRLRRYVSDEEHGIPTVAAMQAAL